MIKKIINKITGIFSSEPQQNFLVVNAGKQSELDLRIVGLFSNVDEEKISEIVTGILYME